MQNAPAPDPVAPFRGMDVYLFDQLLKGRVAREARIFDAGCGGGRNLAFFLGAGYDVWASDADPAALAFVTDLAREQGRAELADEPGRVRLEALESCSFGDAAFDLVICNAVLHFARGEAHFDAMLAQLWRVLAPGGLLFTRLASSIGLPSWTDLGDRRALLPDGSERFLVDEALLLEHTARLGAALADPIKTTVVQGLRCMTTWVLRKS